MGSTELRRERQEVLRIVDRLLHTVYDEKTRRDLEVLRLAIVRSSHPWSELLAC
jgi:hypothetical protein